MTNNKGFTLIELLAVIIILSGVALVAVTSISSSLSKREEKECMEQIGLAKNAAKIYFSLNNEVTVKIGTLISDNYFNETSKIDILKSKYMQYKIKISDNYYAVCNGTESICYDENNEYNGKNICKK